MRGDRASPPPRSSPAAILATAVTAAAVIAGLTYLTSAYGVLLFLGSFAPSALIVFAYPDSPFAQPRNVVLGHLIGSACGLAGLHLLGASWWAPAVAVGFAIALMKLSRAVHPPACSNPLIVFALSQAGWSFLLFPTLAGAALIVGVALVYHNLRREARWPKYWF